MIIDLLLKITTPIICKEGRKILGTGTGFFFQYNENIYLFTNRHVFIDEDRNFYPDKVVIRLNKGGTNLIQNDEITFELYRSNTDDKNWIEIDRYVDLAALKIKSLEGYIFAALSSANLPPKDLRLGLGEQVLVIGYPEGFYDDVYNLPIVRSASIASAYGIPFKKNPFFLVDARLHPGTSGSPIITIPKSVIQMPQGGISITSKPQWYFLGVNSGEFRGLQLNAVWYSSLIIELLKKNEEDKESNN